MKLISMASTVLDIHFNEITALGHSGAFVAKCAGDVIRSSACRLNSRKSSFNISINENKLVSKKIGSQTQSRALQRISLQVRAQEAGTVTVVTQDLEIVWKGGGSEVLLTGDFLDWNQKVLLTKGGEGDFWTKQKVAPGKYAFKFIVDGVWQHSTDYPTIDDGTGGLNNFITVAESSPVPVSKESAPVTAPKPAAPKPAAPKAEAQKSEPKASAPAAPAGKKAVGKAAGKKAAAKPIGPAMEEDIIPLLRSTLEKEENLTDLIVNFVENQLRGSFIKDGVPYSFWCYFPDGILEGPRGFSLATHGGQPSTVEPFLIDERRVTADLLVFWVQKRLFAQKLLSLN